MSSRSSANDTTSIILLGRRSADDDAWYECEASIDKLEKSIAMEGKEVLRIYYHGAEVSDDIICTAKEARSRLRSSCKKLEDGLCSQMQVGEVVLATRTLDEGPFYEAHLKQIHRQRHSSRAPCKCKFGLVWMGKNMKGVEWTAPGSRIRKIDLGSIEGCPMLSKWLLRTEISTFEMADVSEDKWISMLEREIDRITTIAENLTMKEFIAENSAAANLFGLSEATNSKHENTSTKSQSKTKGKLQGILRRGSKRVMASSRTSVKERTHQDSKPRLSPLAARAALASMLPVDFKSPPDCKLEVENKLEELPCMDAKKPLSADYFASGTAALEENSLPRKSIVIEKQGGSSLGPDTSSTASKRRKSQVYLPPGCRDEGIRYKFAESSLTVSDFAAEKTRVHTTGNNTSNSNPSEKCATPSSLNDKTQLQLTASSLAAAGKLEQPTFHASMQSQEQSCKRAGSPPCVTLALTKTRKHQPPSENRPSVTIRPRVVQSTKSRKDLPSMVQNPSAHKKSKRIITRVLEEGSSIANEETNLRSAEKIRQTHKGRRQIESAVCCNLRSPKHSADKRPSGTACAGKLKAAQLPYTSSMRVKQIPAAGLEKEGSLDAVRYNQSRVNNLISKEEDVPGNGLKGSLEQKDVGKRQRTKKSKSTQHGDARNKITKDDSFNVVCDAGSAGSPICRSMPSSKQQIQHNLLLNGTGGNVISAKLESDDQLIVELQIDAHDMNFKRN